MEKRTIFAAVFLVLAMGFAGYRIYMPEINQLLHQRASKDSALAPLLVGEMSLLTVSSEPKPLSDHIIALGDGTPIKLSDLAGKAMLINFWASWCAPCRAEMDELSNLQQEIGDENFEVVAINVDRGGHRMAAEILAEWGIEGLAVYADPSMQTAFDIAGGALPTSLIIDRRGMVRAFYLGALKWDNPEALALFKALKTGRI